MNIITVLLFITFFFFTKKGVKGAETLASLRRGSASKSFLIFSVCHLVIIALKFS